MLEGKKASNFIIHPSVKAEIHDRLAYKVGNYLNDISSALFDGSGREIFLEEYNNLLSTKPSLRNFDELLSFIDDKLKNDEVRILVLNSESHYSSLDYTEVINIIIGGNSIGHGITIPQLQTVYYCRQSKTPQADTMW